MAVYRYLGGARGRRQGGPGRTGRQGAAGRVFHDAFPVAAED